MKAVFITGTDTDVGKTVISALLTKAWDANYWKPIQTGLNCDPGDTATVKQLTGLPEERFLKPEVELQVPLSPWRACVAENIPPIEKKFTLPPLNEESDRPLIIEGAGGLYVPIDSKRITTDIIRELDVPVILVARSGLGTLNHTLLSIEHLLNRNVKVLGVILNGEPDLDNAKTIEHFCPVPVLFSIPKDQNLDIKNFVKYVPSISSILT